MQLGVAWPTNSIGRLDTWKCACGEVAGYVVSSWRASRSSAIVGILFFFGVVVVAGKYASKSVRV